MKFDNILRILSVLTLVFGYSYTPAKSEEQRETVQKSVSYKENFSGNDISIILGGQIELKDAKTKWLTYLSDQKLVMKNEHEANSLHYDDIQWVKYPGTNVLSSSDGATLAVTVEANNEGRGAAGVIVGSGQKGTYWMFGVDGQGRFHVVQKAGRKTYHAHSDKHEVILKGQPNRISYKFEKINVLFFVNETEMIKVPLGRLKPKGYRNIKLPGIGLAAFGIGSYTFDDVEIKPGDTH